MDAPRRHNRERYGSSAALTDSLARRLRAAQLRLERSADARDQLILQAYEAGASYGSIGQAIGMSNVGVRNAVKRVQAGRSAIR